ncbi:MAG TPA: TauD/TfdA family dioxygenase [Xanthobacteraceae bacterium]|jgi:taurine dioxygenase
MIQPAKTHRSEAEISAFAAKPLSPALGAEIVGLDLRREPSPQTVARLVEAWHQHLVLLFRDQSLSEDEQIAFARNFGTLQQRGRPAQARNEASRLKHPELTMLVSNIREDGKLIGSLADGEMHFHSDFCYVEKPAKATFLYAIEVPSQGGDTLFLNMYKAYEALPTELKARLDGRTAVNAYHYESLTREVNAAKIDFSAQPHYAQPIVRTHPDTKRKALYVNRLMTWSVEGMDPPEGSALLDTLFGHIEQDRFIYRHQWRVGDLVLWDNRCTLHARTDFSDKERRLLRRNVIAGERAF